MGPRCVSKLSVMGECRRFRLIVVECLWGSTLSGGAVSGWIESKWTDACSSSIRSMFVLYFGALHMLLQRLSNVLSGRGESWLWITGAGRIDEAAV